MKNNNTLKELKIGNKVLVKMRRALYEGTIEEINNDDISIRPIRCVKGSDIQLDMSIQLQCLLGTKTKYVVEVL